MISVIIPNFNGLEYLGPCLTSVLSQECRDPLEVLLVDNGSTDGSVAYVSAQFPTVHCEVLATNTGFTGAINHGVAVARGELLLLLNNDTVLEPGSLPSLVDALLQAGQRVAAVQPLLVNAADPRCVDSAGIVLHRHFTAADGLHGESADLAPSASTVVFGVCLACALFRREAFDEVGGLDPNFFAEWDDVDLALRCRWFDWSFRLVPQARVRHHRSPTQARLPRARFIRYRRNRLLTCANGLPGWMSVREILYRLQKDVFGIPHHIRARQCGAVLASWIAFLRWLPEAWRRRRALRRTARVTASQMRAMLAELTV
ncbi:glycosyltransferase family 2 protein [candidate division KSB1 bacterium]|nr:glycosyltransferase family 2 protein [candidate division KSB1 bacterium]